jgi:membrane-associated protein
MVFEQFSGIFNILQMNSYIFLFALMVIEGPIITTISAYAASLGIFNVWVILLLSIFGNLIPDIFFYLLGRFGRTTKVESIIKRYFSHKKLEIIEKNLCQHCGKTLCFIKLCPMIPIPGLILSGFTKIPFKKFLFYDILFNVIFSVIFVLFGYYFGSLINSIFKYFRIGQYSIVGVVLLVLIVYIILKKFKVKEKI